MKHFGRIRNNPLFSTLLNIKGNQRACLFAEPLWGIPYNLYIPYATLYMYSLGVNDTQIGLILSIQMIIQVFSAIIGGVMADKLGRRRTLMISDIISWSIPTIIWACAQNFWWFFIAAIFNGFTQSTNVAWQCLIIEDGDDKNIVNLFTWIQVASLIAVFFAPIAAFLVKQFTLVTAVRWIYLFSTVSMTAKWALLYLNSKETEQGMRRMKETKGVPFYKLISGYGTVIKKIFHSPSMMFVLVFLSLNQIYMLVINNFFGLYINQNLGVPDELIALFPMIRAAIMILFILLVQHFFNRKRYRPVMIFGFLLYIVSHLVLMLLPPTSLLPVILYTVLEAVAYSLINPRRGSLSVIFIDKEDRSRVNGIISLVMIGCTAPFGYITGWMSSIHRTLPFIFNCVLFIICILLIAFSKTIREEDQKV